MPVIVLGVSFAALAWAQWTRMAVCARVSLACAAIFGLAAARYPGEGAKAILAHSDDGLVYLVAAARGAGAAVVLITGLALLRSLQSR